MENNSELHFPFDEGNTHWVNDHIENLLYLRGVQSHMNRVLQIRGYVFLNEILAELRIPLVREGQNVGWSEGPIELSIFDERGEFSGVLGNPATRIRLVPEGDISDRLPAYEGTRHE